MTYTVRTGPTVRMVGSFDTLSELNSTHPATSYDAGTMAFVVGTGMMVGDGTNWMAIATGRVAPVIVSGLGTSPTVTTNAGTSAFQLTVGATGTPTDITVLTMPAAPHGWYIGFPVNITDSSKTAYQTASTTTSVTVGWSVAPGNNEVILCSAFPF
jgi:hypothetical protein